MDINFSTSISCLEFFFFFIIEIKSIKNLGKSFSFRANSYLQREENGGINRYTRVCACLVENPWRNKTDQQANTKVLRHASKYFPRVLTRGVDETSSRAFLGATTFAAGISRRRCSRVREHVYARKRVATRRRRYRRREIYRNLKSLIFPKRSRSTCLRERGAGCVHARIPRGNYLTSISKRAKNVS